MRSPVPLALSLYVLTAYGADPALQAVLQRIDKAAATFKGFTADVAKTDHFAIIDENDKNTGTIAVRKSAPGKFQMLEKLEPVGEQIGVNDTRVEVYHAKTNTLNADNVDKKYRSLMQDVLLVGLGGTSRDLLAEYQVTLAGPETIAGQAATKLILIPKDSQLLQSIPKFEVWYSDATGVAVQQKWYDKGLADYHILTYTNMKLGPVTEAQVRLTAPKDAHKDHLISH